MQLEASTTTVVKTPGPRRHRGSHKITFRADSDSEQNQLAFQLKSNDEAAQTFSTKYTALRLVIIHDTRIPRRKLEQVRAALVAIYKPDAPSINFLGTEFDSAN